ncbi:hypothetical protein Y013_13495 [Rhodococcus pyridinivorans SB3094]|uniref:Uncharacterized protein n=1 Tax=Rhodococcus pyridinivorans SB3094 TaxID=1435356 RepID=V9XK10_9NOCA|nr:hypothetical protein Y013_13495 [Rhodococcus pyridinivorans SB3094]
MGKKNAVPAPSTADATAMCHSAIASESASAVTRETVTRFTACTATSTARFGNRSAAIPPTSANASRPALRHAATIDRAVGVSRMAITWKTITTVHIPAANNSAATAPISRR